MPSVIFLRRKVFFPSNPNHPRSVPFTRLPPRYRSTSLLIHVLLSFSIVITRRTARFANRWDASLSFMAGITAGISWGVQETAALRQWHAHTRAHTHLSYTSVIVSRRCTRVTHYMYHVTLRMDTRTYAPHHADECIGRRDKTQSTRKTTLARLFTDFYRLPIANQPVRGNTGPFYLRSTRAGDPFKSGTTSSIFSSVEAAANRVRFSS